MKLKIITWNINFIHDNWCNRLKNINDILNNCKINEKEFFNLINDQKIKNELKNLTVKAFEKDIFGAPTFVVNEKIFWGQDRLEYALDECNF